MPKYMVHKTTGHMHRFEEWYFKHPDWAFFDNYWLACGFSLRTWSVWANSREGKETAHWVERDQCQRST